MNIAETVKKFNPPSDVLIVLILVLSSTASFGLGYLAGKDSVREGVVIDTSQIEQYEELTETERRFVASVSGTRYHLLSCPGAKQIKEENRIYFRSREDAEIAGYTPAANCPGL